MEKDLPNKSSISPVLIGVLCFILGLTAGAGGVYFYSQKVLIPKHENQIISELFGEDSSQWAEFFEEAASEEGEYTNPFEIGSEATSEAEQEEYVNPFENLQ